MQYMPLSTLTRKCLLRPGAFSETEKSPPCGILKTLLTQPFKRSNKLITTTHIRLRVAYQKVTIVSMRIQHRITLTSRDSAIVPTLATQHRPLGDLSVSVSISICRMRHNALHRRRAGIVDVGTRQWVRTSIWRIWEIFLQFLEIISWHETNLTLLIARLEPFRIGWRSIDDLKTIAFVECQLVVAVGCEWVEGDDDVEHILGHRISVRVVVVVFFGRVVAGKPAGVDAALSSPPAWNEDDVLVSNWSSINQNSLSPSLLFSNIKILVPFISCNSSACCAV